MSRKSRERERHGVTRFAAAALVTLLLAACSAGPAPRTADAPAGRGVATEDQEETGGILGLNPFGIFGSEEATPARDGVEVGVNALLWRAALDSLSFMPLQQADPFGGVIISDWYSDPSSPRERFKITVYILDRRLRADALKVAVFRQFFEEGDIWLDAPVNPDTAGQIENAILTQARRLRLEGLEN